MERRGAQSASERLGESGDGKVNRVQWGDVWKVREGAPCPRGVVRPPLGPEKAPADQIIDQGEQRRSAGAWVPDEDWREKVRKNLPGGMPVSPKRGSSWPSPRER